MTWNACLHGRLAETSLGCDRCSVVLQASTLHESAPRAMEFAGFISNCPCTAAARVRPGAAADLSRIDREHPLVVSFPVFKLDELSRKVRTFERFGSRRTVDCHDAVVWAPDDHPIG